MSDTVFRSPVEPSPVKEVEISKPQPDVHESTIEGPYTDYEKQHNHPYVVDHFDLGSMWNIDGVYTDEVKTIEGYLSHKINLGMANDKKAVQGATASRGTTDKGMCVTATNEATVNGAVGNIIGIHYTADAEFVA
jgi:hypothetical protein